MEPTATTNTKSKRAPRTKKAVAAPPEASVVTAFGGAAMPAPAPAPAIFIEEVEVPSPPPKSKKTSARKPAVVASVTPDGIQGTLNPHAEQHPLITHLPIHAADINNDLFDSDIPAATSMVESGPLAYDPTDIFVGVGQTHQLAAVQAPDTVKHVDIVTTTRPSLPVNYSEKLMVRFQDANREQRLPETTDVVCFWDCNPFRGTPCIIPTGIEEGIWRVYGNFCCPECAAAYLFQERLDAHVLWERYALLNRLYATGEETVRLAPARTVLRMFGGSMEVSDYRNLVAEKRLRVDVMTPPMISIIQVMDTKPIDFYDASMKNTFIPWEMDRMNRPGAQGLRIRRTKPVNEKEATLEFCMGIAAPKAISA